MEHAPTIAPYARHLFICTGRYCCPDGPSVALYRQLPQLLGWLGSYENPDRVKRGTSACLGVCAGGPIVVVAEEVARRRSDVIIASWCGRKVDRAVEAGARKLRTVLVRAAGGDQDE